MAMKWCTKLDVAKVIRQFQGHMGHKIANFDPNFRVSGL